MLSKASSERRLGSRLPVRLEVDAIQVGASANEGVIPGLTRDISPSGLFISSSRPLEIGSECHRMLYPEDFPSETAVRMEGLVVRREDMGNGIHFTGLDDTSSTMPGQPRPPLDADSSPESWSTAFHRRRYLEWCDKSQTVESAWSKLKSYLCVW